MGAWIGFIFGTEVMLAFGYADETGVLDREAVNPVDREAVNPKCFWRPW